MTVREKAIKDIKALLAYIETLPDTVGVTSHVEQGMTTINRGTHYESVANGTVTVTIKIAGGATNDEVGLLGGIER